MAVVSVLPLGSPKDPNMMILLHHLSLVAVHHSSTFNTSHSVGCDDYVADTLSHLEFQHFYNLAPYAAPETTPVPSTLLNQRPILWLKNVNFTLQIPCSFHASSLQLCSWSILRVLLPGSSLPFRPASPSCKWRYRNALLLFGSNLPSCQPVRTDLIVFLHRPLKSWQCGALDNLLPRLLWIPESWWIYSE